MPNLFLTSNNVFKGRSFDELLRPLAMYTDVYNQAEQAIGDLQAKAGIWENLANEQTDPIAYATYKKYADDLRTQSQILATSKLNPSTSRNILDLKRRYATDIVPIEQAYANRKAQADEQRKAMLQNPTLLLSRRADLTSLDDYVANPQLGYEVYSGALLAQQVGTAASALAKQLRGAIETGRLDAFTKTWTQKHGYTIDEVYQAINNPHDPKSNKVLTSIVDDAVNGSGIPQWGDRNILKQAYDYAGQGLWNALGETKIEKYDDKGAIIAAEEAKERRLIRERERSQRRLMYERAALAAAQGAGGGVDGPLLKPRPILSARDMADAKADKERLDKYIQRGLIKTDSEGNYYITDAGKRLYSTEVEKWTANAKSGYPYSVSPSKIKVPKDETFNEFINKMFKNGASGDVYSKWNNKGFGKSVGAINDPNMNYDLNSSLNAGISGLVNDELYDLQHETGWVTHPDPSQYKSIREIAIAQRGDLHEQEFDGKQFVDRGVVKKSKLAKYDPVEIESSVFGTRITWENPDDGDVIVTEAPGGANYRMSQTTNLKQKEIYKYQQILQSKRKPKISKKDGSILTDNAGRVQFEDTPLSSDEIKDLENQQMRLLFSADYDQNMWFSTSKTKPREYYQHEPGLGYGVSSNYGYSDEDEDDLLDE